MTELAIISITISLAVITSQFLGIEAAEAARLREQAARMNAEVERICRDENR